MTSCTVPKETTVDFSSPATSPEAETPLTALVLCFRATAIIPAIAQMKRRYFMGAEGLGNYSRVGMGGDRCDGLRF